jgi:hypothetical protein
MISCGTPSIGTVRPSTPRSPAKRRRQRDSPIRTTGRAFGRSSSSTKKRPSVGCTASARNIAAVMVAPRTCSGSPPPSVTLRQRKAPTASKDWLRVAQSNNVGGDASITGTGSLGLVSQRTTSRSASGKGVARRMTRSKIVKMAVFVPMPRASVRTATTANVGRRSMSRRPKRRSWSSIRTFDETTALMVHRLVPATPTATAGSSGLAG